MYVFALDILLVRNYTNLIYFWYFPEVYYINMNYINEKFFYIFMAADIDWGIPKSPEFKIAFIIVTAIYIVSMIVLFILYRKANEELPEELKNSKKTKKSKKDRAIKNK